MHKPIRTLIVDDEPAARRRLTSFLANYPDFELIGECRDGNRALEAIRRERPELVFLDIQMPHRDGFGVLRELASAERPVVIFVTAHDEFALQAFEVNAVDYLLKPFGKERFARSVARARTLVQLARAGAGANYSGLLAATQEGGGDLNRIAIRGAGKIVIVRINDVDWIGSEGNYVSLHFGNKTHLIRDSLNNFHARLDPEKFIRTHRSVVVNAERIAEIVPGADSEYEIVLTSGQRLPLSRRRYREALDALA
ncbi:MAG TPA: response regulator [candidate division Zixibacteria bacterium]|nr:response regulator [candidate division Zixibacteria bacterium]